MKTIEVQIISRIPHVAQILCGFNELRKTGKYQVKFNNLLSSNECLKYAEMSVVRVIYGNKTIIYDLLDGYLDIEKMSSLLDECDLYFKRSFSDEKNSVFNEEMRKKLHPLGLNYHLTYNGCPLNDPLPKLIVKTLLGKESMNSFTKKRFEGKAEFTDKKPKVLFLTRLWDPSECSEIHREERIKINADRIAIIKALKERYGENAIVGINDTPFSRSVAPELIMDGSFTKRKNYLKLLHESDICIASTGLHGSIGWKTAEYVAAAKAIVSEPLMYTVTGNFEVGKNYLSYTDPDSCLQAVDKLFNDPEFMYEIKKNNEKYYRSYLSPEVLVENTLRIADIQI